MNEIFCTFSNAAIVLTSYKGGIMNVTGCSRREGGQGLCMCRGGGGGGGGGLKICLNAHVSGGHI